MSNKSGGFTLVEVAIVTPILVLVAIGIMALLVTLVTNNSTQVIRNTIVGDTRKAFDIMEGDVSSSIQFLPSTLPANFTDNNTPCASSSGLVCYKQQGTKLDGSTSANLTTLLMQNYNQTPDPDASNSSKTKIIPAFKAGTEPCNYITSTQLTNAVPLAILYFVKNGDLFRRTIIDNAGAATCNGAFIAQSCPVGSVSSPCLIEDTKIMTDVTQFKIDYFLNTYDASAMNAYIVTPSPTINLAQAIQITVEVTRKASGEDITHSSTIRLTRLVN